MVVLSEVKQMNINANARLVLEKRYLTRDAKGKVVETVEGLFNRVASAVASADLNYNPNADTKATALKFYDLMTSLEFLPNSPTLMNAGKALGQLSACFVLPIEDSMEEIFETVKNAALIHKSGGGTGFSFSRLRQKGAQVSTTGGVASGPISFMKVFNTATEAVKQGGTRRGANMGILRVDHPDILDFIDCKKNTNEITNFNISVAITEAFMNAVNDNKDYDLIDPKTKKVAGRLNAKQVYDKIVMAAWSNGEPGIIFVDRLNKFNVTPTKGEIESTNPCGEQPLLPYESCNLGSINLSMMLAKTKKGYEIDYNRLGDVVDKAIHFLDNVIDVNKYPLDIIAQTTLESRKIGLGVMGFADMLLLLNIAYNSEQGVETGREVMKFINDRANLASQKLALTRGAFPLFNKSTLKGGPLQRNATVTTIAPTGTLSIIASCSSGIEPVFAYAYFRNVMDGTKLLEGNAILKEELIKREEYSEEIMTQIANEGTLHNINVSDQIKRVFVSAHDIDPKWHIEMQAAFQDNVGNAVSKTVNFPSTATIKDVDDVYRLAFSKGLKGVTIYRDKSRENQVLNIGDGKQNDKITVTADSVQAGIPRSRPDVVNGFTEKVQIGCGNLYITVNYDEKGVVEVFTNTGKAGGCPSQSEATARLLSIALRSGVDTDTLLEQLRGIRCPSTIRQPGMKVTSCPDAIAKVIRKVIDFNNSKQGSLLLDKPIVDKTNKANEAAKEISSSSQIHFCPVCGTKVEHEGGCVVCRNCSFSKCG